MTNDERNVLLELVARDVQDYIFEHLAFDGIMHRQGKCSFPLTSICAAEEHKIKNMVYDLAARIREMKKTASSLEA